MKEFRIKGSYYDMGKTFGKTLSNWHRQFKPNDKLLEFARKCEDAVAKFAPDILDELRGIAEVSGAKYESLISTMLSPFFLFGCTVFAIKGEYTANGNPIFARQMDWLMEDVDSLCAIYTEPNDAHKSIGFSFGDCGRYGGQNEDGLTIGSASLARYTGKVKPGVRMNISTRWILDKLSTTEETVDYLTRIPHTEAMAFLVADKSGTIARVEAASEKTEARYLEEGIDVVTNIFVLDGMKHLDSGLPKDSHTYAYCDRLQEWFEANNGNITLEDVKAICSDPEKGVCQTSKQYEVTIWSWVASIDPPSIEIAPGPPCNTQYKALH